LAEYTDVTFRILTEHVPRYINGVAGYFGYDEIGDDGEPNAETKTQYARRKIRYDWIRMVKRHETREAAEAIVTEPIEVIDG